MSVIIKGIEMPKNCDECPCYYETEGAWRNECEVFGKEHTASETRPEWCPLIPATPHGRWIKPTRVPDSMLDECSLCGFDCGSYTFNYCPCCGARMDADEKEPTAIEAEEEE